VHELLLGALAGIGEVAIRVTDHPLGAVIVILDRDVERHLRSLPHDFSVSPCPGRVNDRHSTMHLYPIDGATSRVPEGATAFAYRDGGWAGVIVGVDPDPANAGLISQWARDYWQELHPTSAGGAYVNFLMSEGQDRVKASYRGNYDRLAQVKDRYDPDNVFHVNQNIRPASESGR